MDRHRRHGEANHVALPRPAAAQLSLGAFIVCPVPYGNPLELFWQQDFQQIADCGFDLMRWGTPWSIVEPKPGVFRWDLVDPKVELATRLGLAAIDAAHDGAWGTMAALHRTHIELVRLSDAVAEVRAVPVEEYQRFGVLFG